MKPLAQDLASNAFGAALLDVVGYAYEMAGGARAARGAGARGAFALRRRAHALGTRLATARSLGKAGGRSLAARCAEKREATLDAAAAAASKQKRESELTLSMLEVMWRLTVVDVETTLRAACHKVLNDHGAARETRLARAGGLAIVGRAFRAAAAASGYSGNAVQALRDTIGGAAAPSAAPAPAAPEPASREELLELSVGQLKKLARERGVDVSTALEKAHIVDALLSARKE